MGLVDLEVIHLAVMDLAIKNLAALKALVRWEL